MDMVVKLSNNTKKKIEKDIYDLIKSGSYEIRNVDGDNTYHVIEKIYVMENRYIVARIHGVKELISLHVEAICVKDSMEYVSLIYNNSVVQMEIDKVLGIIKSTILDDIKYYDIETLEERELSDLEIMLAKFEYVRDI